MYSMFRRRGRHGACIGVERRTKKTSSLRWFEKEKNGHTGARTQDHSVISTALYRLSYTTSSFFHLADEINKHTDIRTHHKNQPKSHSHSAESPYLLHSYNHVQFMHPYADIYTTSAPNTKPSQNRSPFSRKSFTTVAANFTVITVHFHA